jgi:sugar phosphate isomerase/epimerase
MRSIFLRLQTCLFTSLLLVSPLLSAAPAGGGGDRFKGPLGLQLYSLRKQFDLDLPGTLDDVRRFGFRNVELAGTYGLTPEKFKAQLDAHGLKAVSGHFPYDRFRDDVEGIARDAKTLGLEYVGCAWIPHDDKAPFDTNACRAAGEVFNKAGEALARHGLKFFYHIHGYEFQPLADGTLFDLLAAETNPKFVNFQMDVFWVVHAGQDPVKLLEKHPKRWQSMHLKGMKEGTPIGQPTGHSEDINSVPLGTGRIDYPPILRAARKAGVKWYFIEDESPLAETQIPQSFYYLVTLSF